MGAIFTFLLLLILLIGQIIIGNFGLYLPLVPIGIFYVAITYDWPRGILTAVACGLVIDTIYGRFMPLTPFLYIVIVGSAVYFRSRYDLRHINANIIPGGIITIPGLAPLWVSTVVAQVEILPQHLLNHILPLTLFASLFGCAFLPLLILLADHISGKLGLPRYLEVANSTTLGISA